MRGALEEVEEADPLPFVGSVQGNQCPRVIAATILQTLRFNLDEYRRQPTIDAAFRLLREAVESIGVYVMLMGNLGHHTTNISPRAFRGFALADDVAPFIVINENDSHSAWTFTLIHELAHVFLGQSGISGYDGDQDIEQLCDEVAACFLLRPGELQEIDARRLTNDALVEQISEFARTRRVSRKMVAFNLRKTGAINWDRYQELSARFDAERLEAAARPQRDGTPDYYVVRRHRMGPGLTRLVERMIGIGVLTSTKAGRILGVNPTAVGRMAASNRAAWGWHLVCLLDADTLITGDRNAYPVARFPVVWEWLLYHGTSGRVRIPIEQYEEVVRGWGDLVDWLRVPEHKQALVLGEDADLELVQHVLEEGYGRMWMRRRLRRSGVIRS